MSWSRVIDGALELPVVPSFTRVGYDIRRLMNGWDDETLPDLSGRVALITGATSGLGRACAAALAELGAHVIIGGRDDVRTATAAAEIQAAANGSMVSCAVADVGDLEAVRSMAADVLADYDRLDVLIHNAGALSAERTTTAAGFEATIASQVYGPHLLTSLLLDRLRSTAEQTGRASRVITMSSGGMYAAPLSVNGLEMSESSYRGATQYARAKRAQVTLNKMWADRVNPTEVVFHSLHPGWADTPGVEDSLPLFATVLGPVLRSPEQGADTMIWLAAEDEPLTSSGGFWLDRRPRRLHKTPLTARSDTSERRVRLWDAVEAAIDR